MFGVSDLLPDDFSANAVSQDTARLICEKAARFSHPSFAKIRKFEKCIPAIQGRLKAWERIVRTRTGRTDFDIDRMIGNATTFTGRYFSNLPIPIDLRIVEGAIAYDHTPNGVQLIPSCNITYPTLNFAQTVYGIVNPCDSAYTFINYYNYTEEYRKLYTFPAPAINFTMAAEQQKAGLLVDYSAAQKNLVTVCGHDLYHNFTFLVSERNGDVRSEVVQFILSLHTSNHNRKTLTDVEHMALMMNQEVFLDLRDGNGEFDIVGELESAILAFRNVGNKLLKSLPAGKLYEDVKSALKAEAIFHVSNYAPKKLLLMTPMAKWGEALRIAQPEYQSKELKCVIGGVAKTMTYPEITLWINDQLEEILLARQASRSARTLGY